MTNTQQYFHKLYLPQPNSHKGQNGKLLLIGGSDLFHAASKWSLDVASKFVDMVMYASIPSNNEIIQEVKKDFWNGIVVRREEIEAYIEEVDCVLIGPGMTRDRSVDDEWTKKLFTPNTDFAELAKEIDWNADTYAVTNYLLAKYPHKKWVIDAGALQMVETQLLNAHCILTPHHKEFELLFGQDFTHLQKGTAHQLSQKIGGATVVLKAQKDVVFSANDFEVISGGNGGMTKGGTGDVLAGLIAALYTKNDAIIAAVVGSYINKKTGDELYTKVGPNFNASDLVEKIPEVLWQEIQNAT